VSATNIKNLILGFLALSIFSTSVSFALLSWQTEKLTGKESAQIVANSGPKISPNAFVETVPEYEIENSGIKNSEPVGDAIAPKINASDSLTDKFIKEASYDLIKKNPNGPQELENGVGLIADPNSINARLISKNNTIGYIAENWSKTAESITFKTTENSTDSFKKYLIAINSGYSITDLSNNILALEESSLLGNEKVKNIKTDIDGYIELFSKTPVPEYFSTFHRQWLNVLIAQKKSIEISERKVNDPYVVALEMEANRQFFVNASLQLNTEVKRLTDEIKNAQKLKTGNTSDVQKIFGIKTAHAWGLPVIEVGPLLETAIAILAADTTTAAATTTEVAETFWQWLYKTVVRILVKTLINQIQKDLVNWIAGGGKPKFLTNWKDLLSKTGNKVADEIISKQAPKLCESFGPLVEIGLQKQSDAADKSDDEAACTLSEVIKDAKKFFDDFNEGGWIAFSTKLRPENQLWGSIFIIDDKQTRQAAKSTDAKKAESTAASGFKSGNVKCNNPSTLKTTNLGYTISAGTEGILEEQIVATTCKKIPPPAAGQPPSPEGQQACTITYCGVDDFSIDSPGGAVANSLFGSFSWKPNQISAAQTLHELVAALIDASINRLTNLATEWVSGLGDDSGGGVTCTGEQSGPGCSTTSAGVDQPPGRPVVDGVPSSGDGDQVTNTTQYAQKKIDKIKKIIDNYNSLQQMLLTGPANQCPTQFQQIFSTTPTIIAQQLQQQYESFSPSLIESMSILQSLQAQLQGLDQNKPEDAQKIAEINKKISETPNDDELNRFKNTIDTYLKNPLFTSFTCTTTP
jgi:hypothetical protein